MSSLTSDAAWGSSSIRASEKLWKNLPRKQQLQQGSLTKERTERQMAKVKKITHRWDDAGPAAAAAIPSSHESFCLSVFYLGYQLRRRPGGENF